MKRKFYVYAICYVGILFISCGVSDRNNMIQNTSSYDNSILSDSDSSYSSGSEAGWSDTLTKKQKRKKRIEKKKPYREKHGCLYKCCKHKRITICGGKERRGKDILRKCVRCGGILTACTAAKGVVALQMFVNFDFLKWYGTSWLSFVCCLGSYITYDPDLRKCHNNSNTCISCIKQSCENYCGCKMRTVQNKKYEGIELSVGSSTNNITIK